MSASSFKHVILGCGDVGRRIVSALLADADKPHDVTSLVKTLESQEMAKQLGIDANIIDLDADINDALDVCHQAQIYYTVAPQKYGIQDQRSRSVISVFNQRLIQPTKVVLISTTGVYGDCDGQWVSETSPTNPTTERGQRRLDSEQQWLAWGQLKQVPVVILRVPGIYAFSRLPRQRIAQRTPVVVPEECGFSNRIHADDLARICIAAMRRGEAASVFNATDGNPGKISDYLQAAAHALGHSPLPEISMTQAQSQLTPSMLSYLSESRKISNQKMLDELGITLSYPDYRQGILA